MTRDEARGQYALKGIDRYIHPKPYFVPRDGNEKLYKAEEKRTKAIIDCAKLWQEKAEVAESDYWTITVPQVLHDALENWDTAASIVACEAFLIRHGWKIERPELDPGLE
jgi:hypothetical protein